MTMRDAERHDAARVRALGWLALALASWIGGLVVLFAWLIDPNVSPPLFSPPAPPRALLVSAIVAAAAGGVASAAAFARLTWLDRRARRDPALLAALDDERSRANGLKACAVAFGAVLVAALVAIPLEVRFGVVLTAKTFGLVVTWLGAVTALAAFVVLERRDAA